MKLEINKETLKTLITKAFKGSGRIPALQKTMILGIEYEDNKLYFTTTDRVNIVRVSTSEITNLTPNCTHDYCAVDSDLFNKLINKTTSDSIVLEFGENNLIFKGNGTYQLPRIGDTTGNDIRIDIPSISSEVVETIDISKLKQIITLNRPSVAKSMETPYLTGYYFDNDSVVTFNNITACVSKEHFVTHQVLLPSSFVELFNIIDDVSAELYLQGNGVKVLTPNVTVYSMLMTNVDSYPSDALKNIIEEPFSGNCTIDKATLLNAIDRLSLFVSQQDSNSIRISFGADGIRLSSLKGTGDELIPFISDLQNVGFVKTIELQDFRSQVQTQPSNEINLFYGNERGLMLKNDTTYQLIPFMVFED